MVEEIEIAFMLWNGFNKFVLAVIFLFMGFILGKLVERFLYRFINDLNFHGTAKKAGLSAHLEKNISKVASYVIYILAIAIALKTIHLDKITLAFFISVILSALIISIAFNIIYFIPNFVAGFKLHKKLKNDDQIKIGNFFGRINKIGYNVVLENEEGDVVYYPASLVLEKIQR